MTDALAPDPHNAPASGPRPPDGCATALAVAVPAGTPHTANALARARAFAEPLLANETLDTGENILAHVDAMVDILDIMGGTPEMQAAAYLVYACEHLNRPHEVIAKAFGDNFAQLAVETTKLVQLQRQARGKAVQVQAQREAGLQGGTLPGSLQVSWVNGSTGYSHTSNEQGELSGSGSGTVLDVDGVIEFTPLVLPSDGLYTLTYTPDIRLLGGGVVPGS